MRSDDLAPLLGPDPGDPNAVRWGKGDVVSWNSTTGENVIRWRGVDLVNVPIVASSVEVLQIQAGDVVGLNIIGGGATATVYIVGRITQPSPNAKQAIINTLSGNVFGASVATNQTLAPNPGVWSNLATVGPTVSNVEIVNGRCLVTVGCYMTHPGSVISLGAMSFEITGATSAAPTRPRGIVFSVSNEGWIDSKSKTILVEGLNAGLHTFTAKYENGSSASNVSFQDRHISVVAF